MKMNIRSTSIMLILSPLLFGGESGTCPERESLIAELNENWTQSTPENGSLMPAKSDKVLADYIEYWTARADLKVYILSKEGKDVLAVNHKNFLSVDHEEINIHLQREGISKGTVICSIGGALMLTTNSEKILTELKKTGFGHILIYFSPSMGAPVVIHEWNKISEQAGTGQPATRPESKSEGGDKPQSESEGRPR